YDLGRWKAAVDLWMQAYETYNAPEFLFNIGQAYRHEGNCEQGLFFYRRYLATKPNAKNRGEVEGFIKDLEAKCKAGAGTGQPEGGRTPGEGGATGETGESETSSTSGRKPGQTGRSRTTGAGSAPVADAGDTGEAAFAEEDDGEEYEQSVEAEADTRARFFAARVAAGPSFPSLGPLEVGTLVSVTVGVGHPLYLGPVVLEPGALVTYSPVPWEVAASETSGTAALTGLLANVGVSYEFIPKLSGRADIGFGALVFSGLTEMGNPFLDMNDFADGPISMFHARAALGAEYAITNNFVVHAQPVVFSFSPSRPLRQEIDNITRFEVLVGAGYKL
ncbi:MAG TPA: hypothetical protein VNO33_10380, partial [Kofleriaceae bacterium]|nr:hypothetical protein [Kofleriaceae bacterium]